MNQVKFAIYRERFRERNAFEGDRSVDVRLDVIQIIGAASPSEALRKAKRLGHFAPIIGPAPVLQ